MKQTLLAIAATLPLWAAAQEAAPQLQEDPRAARIREVERGLFVGFEVGYLGVDTPAGIASGFVTGVHAGYDVTPRLALAAFALASSNSASAPYSGFDLLALGADARFGFLALTDSGGTERFYVYLHGRLGMLRSYPFGLFAEHDLLLGGGLGIEYFTRLRHFSVGLAADVLYVKDAKEAGLALVPTVRYTF